MENEEEEDLLVEITESDDEVRDKEIDYYIEDKILDFLQSEKQNPKTHKKALVLIGTCLLVFLAASVLITVLPIYVKYSSSISSSTYSKLFTISSVNVIFFITAHIIGALPKCDWLSNPNFTLCFPDVFKVGLFLSFGSVASFWLIDGNYISCHLEDPLKGCTILFSLLFYYLFSRKKMSIERTFCAITITVGVFVSVDFGICDKFRCNGKSKLTEITSKFHLIYVILYLLVHGIWVLHYTLIEVCWTSFKSSNSALNVSVLSNVTINENSPMESIKESSQSLSIIYHDDEEDAEAILKRESLSKVKSSSKSSSNSKCLSISGQMSCGKLQENSLNNSVPYVDPLSVLHSKKFPVTSTPKNDMAEWHSWSSGRCYDVALWQHIICWLMILGICWLPTISFLNDGKDRILADVFAEIIESFRHHAGFGSGPECDSLPTVTVVLSLSYVILVLSSLELLKNVQSAVTVISIMMPALPVSSLFWTLFHMNEGSCNFLEFKPEVTGEAVCAILGLPLIGIGIVLLLKAHIREFQLPSSSNFKN